ncbi:hypothetical protein NLI96_g11964 [Meripilus lineatus]|uniref:Ubiquitin carboxyl-terminal hydrolase n=1 Tax=Meripilus lineatus TaxID=2056292 RepID=A0AAD5USF9_9APHY|nr:hypothetical protein NLI96_g11964 [Physisporinus lineatus]
MVQPQPQMAQSPQPNSPLSPLPAPPTDLVPPSPPQVELVQELEPPRSPTPPSPQTEHLQEPSPPPSERATSPEFFITTPDQPQDHVSELVIWSRKGHPSTAPGIIISPRANPPQSIVERALRLPSPPPSPKPQAKEIVFVAPSEPDTDHESEQERVQVEAPEKQEHSPEPEVISSSATESTPACSTAPDTPIPASPISTNTSVSAHAVSSPTIEKPTKAAFPVVTKAESVVSELSAVEAAPTVEVSAPVPSVSVPVPAPSIPPVVSSAPTPTPSGTMSLPSTSAPTVSAPSSSTSLAPVPLESSVSASSSSTATAATVSPAKPAPLKKSWNSLFSSDKASPSKSGLPVSSVIGFSIPASAMLPSPTSSTGLNAGMHFSVRPELLNLLQHGAPSLVGGSGPPKIRPRGLINTGNMCFANAVMQVLVYCPQFNRLFWELGKYLPGPVVGGQKEGTKATPLVDATVQFLREFMPPDSYSQPPPKAQGKGKLDAKAKGKEREEVDDFYEPESFLPTFVYDVMKEKKRFANMVGGHQEDAEEFFGFFLDTLEEELLTVANSFHPAANQKVNPPVEEKSDSVPHDDGWYEVGKKNRTVVTRTIKSAESPITRIFGGKFRSTLRAPHQRDSVTIEDWRALRLDIQRDQIHTVKDALQFISHPQSVQITSPTRPGVVIDASQQTLIESLPPILVLHMKRFHYDTDVKYVVKIGKQVSFGPDLEISPDLISPAARKSSQPVKYQLIGVLYHHGPTASGGHYTLDVLHPNRDMNDRPRAAWIRIDDELVSDIRAEDVFGGSDRDDRCAYLLFYRRIGAGVSTKAWAQHVGAKQ